MKQKRHRCVLFVVVCVMVAQPVFFSSIREFLGASDAHPATVAVCCVIWYRKWHIISLRSRQVRVSVELRYTSACQPTDQDGCEHPAPFPFPEISFTILSIRLRSHLFQRCRRDKVKSMRASIDNSAPPKFKHMKRNLKKEQTEEGVCVLAHVCSERLGLSLNSTRPQLVCRTLRSHRAREPYPADEDV